MHYVYFIRSATDPAYIKIGISNRPHHRLTILQIGSPAQLELLHLLPCGGQSSAREVEMELHRFFRAKHYRGEWFQITELEVISLIQSIYEDEERPMPFGVPRGPASGRLGRALALDADTDEIVRVQKLKIQ